jgi:uroporphyrinogen decarboxylase
MPIETMTPRERWLAVLGRQKPDRIPMDFWGTDEITQKLIDSLGCASRVDMLKQLHVDFVVSVEPRYVGPNLVDGEDEFGRRGVLMDYGQGTYLEITHYPLAHFQSVADIEANYTWPNPDWWDYSEIGKQLRGLEEYPVRGGGSEPFLIYKELRGQEQAMMDLVLHPDIVHYCLDHLFDLAYQNTLRILEAIPGRVDVCYVAEDMGGQRDLMFSPAHIREFLFPGMQRMIDLAHQGGAKVFHHNDGNITRILPELIALGIDLLNPIQWRADNMDREALKRQFGDQVVFHGAVDNQYTLPFGSPTEVRQEVLDNLRILGAGGGYILAPCHNLQPITPIENILAMYASGYEAGWL